MHKKNRGFTLVELMVTIAVLAILSGLAAPSMIKMIRENQVRVEVLDFINLVSQTRSEAIFRQTTRILALDPTVTTRYILWEAKNKVSRVGTTPTSLSFNFMGNLISDKNQCFEFQSSGDSNIKAFVVVRTNGSTLYDQSLTSCPTTS